MTQIASKHQQVTANRRKDRMSELFTEEAGSEDMVVVNRLTCHKEKALLKKKKKKQHTCMTVVLHCHRWRRYIVPFEGERQAPRPVGCIFYLEVDR